jgi:hypothetical protein
MFRILFLFISVVMVILLMTIGPGLAFKEDIVAAWLMDEGSGKTVKDFVGNYSDGEINGKAEWVDGKSGKALRFDGSGGHVQVPFNPEFQVLNETDFTFALWFKTETLPTDRGTWIAGFQQMDANGTGRTWMGLQDSTDMVYSALGNIRPTGAVPEVDQWCHFALVVEEAGAGDNLKLYSNGKLETEMPLSVETSEGDYLIGCHKNLSADNSWEGVIDDVVIIAKALTEEELEQLMNNGLSGILAVESRGKLTTTWG